MIRGMAQLAKGGLECAVQSGMLAYRLQRPPGLRSHSPDRRSLNQRGQWAAPLGCESGCPQQLGKAGEDEEVHICAAVAAQFMAQVKPGIRRWDNDSDRGEGIAALKIRYKGEKSVSSTGIQWLYDKRHLFPH
jgi:hypothetical protein